MILDIDKRIDTVVGVLFQPLSIDLKKQEPLGTETSGAGMKMHRGGKYI